MKQISMPKKRGGRQINCFQCKAVANRREGSWKHQGNQEVFICAVCEQGNQIKVPRPELISPARKARPFE